MTIASKNNGVERLKWKATSMPANKMLMVEATAALLILKTKMYFKDKELAECVNISYQVTRIRSDPARGSKSERTLQTYFLLLSLSFP
jgi:hypothetical protein